MDLRVHSCSFLKVHNAYNLKIFLLGVFTRPHPVATIIYSGGKCGCDRARSPFLRWRARVGATGHDLSLYPAAPIICSGESKGGCDRAQRGRTRSHPLCIMEGKDGFDLSFLPCRTRSHQSVVIWKSRVGATGRDFVFSEIAPRAWESIHKVHLYSKIALLHCRGPTTRRAFHVLRLYFWRSHSSGPCWIAFRVLRLCWKTAC